MLQRIDEEAQHRQIAGDRFEFVLGGAVVGLGKPLDLGAAARGFPGRRHGRGPGQGAIDLVEGLSRAARAAPFSGKAEVAVEGLLDLDQVALDLSGDLPDQQFLLTLRVISSRSGTASPVSVGLPPMQAWRRATMRSTRWAKSVPRRRKFSGHSATGRMAVAFHGDRFGLP